MSPWTNAEMLRAFKHVLLSHHPSCHEFDDHVLVVGKEKKTRLCIGCLAGYPPFFFFLSIVIAVKAMANHVNTGLLLLPGLLLAAPAVLHVFGLVRSRRAKVFTRALVGTGLGLAGGAILTLDGPSLLFNIILFIFIYYACNMGFSMYRMVRMQQACTRCHWKGDWRECPGMLGATRQGAVGSENEPIKEE